MTGPLYTDAVEQLVVDLLAWLEPRALLLAVVLPPVIRIVGHWIPEELFMISMGVLAARTNSPLEALFLLATVVASHFLTDQVVFSIGCWLRPRLGRFKRIASRLEMVTARLQASPRALYFLIPARVFPLGRGSWMAGCGVVGISWRRFAAVDLLALLAHLATWSGLGWWLADDLSKLQISAEVAKEAGMWLAAGLIVAALAVMVWRTRLLWQPGTVRVVRRASRTLRQLSGV
jgi:membrane protein DedA with SNARE-associated domain